MREVLNHYDIADGINGDAFKDKLARIMVNAILKIADSNNNIKKGLDGVVELRLFAPIFLYIPHRNNDVSHNKQQLILRERLFKEVMEPIIKKYYMNKKRRTLKI